MLHHPLRQVFQLGFRIIFAGYQQRGDFSQTESHAGYIAKFPTPPANARRKSYGRNLGEGFQVDIGRVHVSVELGAGFGALVAGDTATDLMPVRASLGRVDGVFVENDRVVVGVGHAAAVRLLRGAGDGLGRGLVHQAIHLPRLADVQFWQNLQARLQPAVPKENIGVPGGNG